MVVGKQPMVVWLKAQPSVMGTILRPVAAGLMLVLGSACTPTVQVAMPSEPININLNVKIEHEIYVKVDRQLDEMFSESSGLF